MVPAGGDRKQQDERWSSRHRVKLLNMALLVYLCSGAFLLDHWSDSFSLVPLSMSPQGWPSSATEANRKQEAEAPPVSRRSMEELRNGSAKRMWDITNKLNILYEANWTAQVLDELAEFQRRLEELKSVGRDKSGVHVDEKKEELMEGSRPKVDPSGRKRAPTHLRKALIQCLAILTGAGSGSPLGEPQTSAAKLITLLYACLGIPLLICTIACSGGWLAAKSLNVFLKLSHYGYALPIHYLCHSLGLKWLCYCCWCCCCYSKCNLCCCQHTNTNCISSCCDTSTNSRPHRPRLHLSNRSAASSTTQPQTHQHKPASKVSFKETQAEESDVHSLHSLTLFLTYLTSLLAYLTLGARVYSKLEDKSLLDGLLISFQLISGTRFPDSFIASTTTQAQFKAEAPMGNSEGLQPQPVAAFMWHFLYLFAGLNLVSVCVHIGWLVCFSPAPAQQADRQIKTNGFLAGLQPETHDLQDKLHATDPLASLTSNPIVVMNAPPPSAVTNQLAIQRQPTQQHHSQLDLRELFVAVEQSPAELHMGCAQAIQGQQLSDISFASTDRSTEHGSLCLHHQAQYSHQRNSCSPANSFSALYAPTNAPIYRQQVAPSKLQYTNGYQMAAVGQPRVSLSRANQEFQELEEETRFGDEQANWHTKSMPISCSSNHLSAHLSNGGFQPQESGLMNSCDVLTAANPLSRPSASTRK